MKLQYKCSGEYSSECNVRECATAFGLKYLNNLTMVSQAERDSIEIIYREQCNLKHRGEIEK